MSDNIRNNPKNNEYEKETICWSGIFNANTDDIM